MTARHECAMKYRMFACDAFSRQRTVCSHLRVIILRNIKLCINGLYSLAWLHRPPNATVLLMVVDGVPYVHAFVSPMHLGSEMEKNKTTKKGRTNRKNFVDWRRSNSVV